jgi:diguanylate cyclase (GGDEF)-like protein
MSVYTLNSAGTQAEVWAPKCDGVHICVPGGTVLSGVHRALNKGLPVPAHGRPAEGISAFPKGLKRVSASIAIHDISAAMNTGPSSERRRHARYPVQVSARLALPGGDSRSCRIKDFGAGGLFLTLEEKAGEPGISGVEALTRDARVLVQFSGEQGASGRTQLAQGLHCISAPVARVLPQGLGLAFTNLDPTSAQGVRQLALLVRNAQACAAATPAVPAGTPAKAPGAAAGDAMHTVRCLLGLERHIRSSGSTPESVAAIATSEPAAAPVDPLARELIIDALAILRRAPEFRNPDESEPLALQDRLMTTWEAAGLSVTEADGIVVEIVSKLLDAMLDDPLVRSEIKHCIRRLAIPLVKVALQDGYFFFANEQHPARMALNRLGGLEPSIIGAERWRSVIHPLVDQVLADSDQGGKADGYAVRESVFSEVLVHLDAIFEEQNRRYHEMVADVVRENAKQQTLLDSLSAADAVLTSRGLQAGNAMPLELQRWLGHVDQLKPGDVVYRRRRESETEKLSLAAISDDGARYLFVDAAGYKAASTARQELAMQLRRGDVWMVDASKLPIVERGLFRMLNELHGRIVHQVHVDEASGLLNRKGLEASVQQALHGALTMGSSHALCILELDALGTIIQKCGQQVAGELLRNFVPVLKNHVRHKGVAARLQAGRFAVLLQHCSTDNATTLMDTLRAAMENSRCKWHEESFRLTIGAGVAPIDAHSGSVLALFEAADEAYRAARAAGGNCVRVHQRSDSAADNALAASSMISRAIAEDRLQLRCQRVTPIAGDASALPQYEILLGVKNGHGETVLPGEFLRTAERHNQMQTVDRWVIETVIRWMADNSERVERADAYSINVSASTLADENLLDFVRGLLAATRVSATKIVFEITESSTIDSLPVAVNFIHAIKEHGCRVCLDKFGSAQASLARLETLPIDYVKIDGALVRDIAADPRDLMVVRSLNEIGHFLGKKTVAECVESPEVLARLRQIGVDYAQGYGIEEPFLLQ